LIALEQQQKQREKYETEKKLWLKSQSPEAHLKRLEERIERERTREYTCPHCYNVNKVNNWSFVKDALDIIRCIQKTKK
jgi:hypothetical protein